MSTNNARDLFQLQSELIDMKVDMAVTKAIDRVIDKINDLKNEMHDFRDDVKQRLTAVETKLGMVNETENEIRARIYDTEKQVRNNIIDYTFRAGWLLLGAAMTYVLYQFHTLIK